MVREGLRVSGEALETKTTGDLRHHAGVLKCAAMANVPSDPLATPHDNGLSARPSCDIARKHKLEGSSRMYRLPHVAGHLCNSIRIDGHV